MFSLYNECVMIHLNANVKTMYAVFVVFHFYSTDYYQIINCMYMRKKTLFQIFFLSVLFLFSCSGLKDKNKATNKPRTISSLLIMDSLDYYTNPLRNYDVAIIEKKLGDRIIGMQPELNANMTWPIGLNFTLDVKNLPSDSITMMFPLLSAYMNIFNTIYGGNAS